MSSKKEFAFGDAGMLRLTEPRAGALGGGENRGDYR